MTKRETILVAGLLAFVAGLLTHASVHTSHMGNNVVAPWSETARNIWAFAVAVGMFFIVLCGLPRLQRLSSPKKKLAWLGVSGWTLACLSLALFLSFWHALDLAFGPRELLTPVSWIIARALIVGFFLSLLPDALTLYFLKRLPNGAH